MAVPVAEAGEDLAAPMVGAYEPYWGLELRPFENVPDPRFYVRTAKHESAKQRVLYGIHMRKGMVMLTGEIGCGKTLLSRSLILELPRNRYEVGLVANPSIPVSEFLGEMLFQLGLPPGVSKADQLRRLNDRLLANYHRGVDTVLVVDEAQAIGDDQSFEDLRLLSNFQLNDRFLMTVVLLGQPELRDRVARIPQLAQRLAIHYHIERFNHAETKSYILGRLQAAGSSRNLFSSGAITCIYERTGGVCRLINALCDLCLYFGSVNKAPYIGRTFVRRIGDDMALQSDGKKESTG